MNKNCSRDEHASKRGARLPLLVALAVAMFGVLGMLIVDHGPWTRPKVQTVEAVHHTTTGAAAQAVGATVTPTPAKPEIEPEAPGPKPVQPGDVVAPKS
jgi:hypothetical protein